MDIEMFDWQEMEPHPVIGVDEVGRGCLAGPVYAAAVVLNPAYPWRHYTDSKALSAKRREALAEEIRANHKVSVAFATVAEIDRMNILNASLLAMARAVTGLRLTQGHILVDGTFRIPGISGFEQTTLVKGDLRAEPVAAASIVAKVTRDQVLNELAEKFPEYGFGKHKGYGTKEHQAAIRAHGPCAEHRISFAPIKEWIAEGQ